MTGANLVSANYVTGTLTTAAQPNITSVGTLSSLAVTANITAGNINAGNLLTANYSTSVLTTAAQPNITSVGTLTSLAVTGNTTTGNLTGANLVSANYVTGTLTTAAQPNITSVGTLSSLAVTANITAGNINAGNLLTANYSTSVLTTAAQPNITSVGTLTSLAVTGNTTTGNLTGANLVSANYVTGTLTTAAQPNITSVGTLTTVAISGNITSGNSSTGNLVANSTVNFTNASNVALGAVANVKITGGSSSQYLQTDGTGNLTWATISTTVSSLSNGNSNVNVATANGNVTISAVGNANIVTVTGTGVNVSGTLNTTGTASLGNLSISGNTTLPNIASIYLPGGTANYVIKTDGNGNLSWTSMSVGTGNANISGSNTQLFFNNANSNTLGASANLTFNNSTNTLSTTNFVATGTTNLGAVGNVTITGGSANALLKTDGSGTLSWYNPTYTTVTADDFTGNGVQTAFTLSVTPTSANYTIVSVGGVVQPKTTYTVSGNVLTFSGAPPSTAPVEITTINSGITSLGNTGGGGGSTGITYNGVSANTTMVAGNAYIINTSSAAITMTLPASSTLGDIVGIIDGTGNSATNNITISGANIAGSSSAMVVSTNRAAFQLVYYNATQGWLLTSV